MNTSKHLSHWLSLKCYEDAQKDRDAQDSSPYPKQSEDLESLVGLFGSGNLEQPARFAFSTHAPNLLIVEDEDSLAELLKRTLVERGYPGEAIHVFKWSEEAILYARNHAVGIAFVDIFLYNLRAVRNIYISGLQVLAAIKETSPGAKVILISGHAPYEMISKAILELGASYFLGKPFDGVDIVRIVHWAVERLLGPEAKRISPSATSPEVRPVTRTKRSEKVLIVDDDRSVAEIISLALHAFGYHTMIVERGREALGILQGSRFDAVVLDIRMPDMDGLEVLRHIRERDKNIIVMILTAIGDEETAREAIRLEANGYFMKPFNVNLLQLNLEYAFLLQQTKRDMP